MCCWSYLFPVLHLSGFIYSMSCYYRCIIYQVGPILCYLNKRNLGYRIHIQTLNTSQYLGQYKFNIYTTLIIIIIIIIIYTVTEILFPLHVLLVLPFSSATSQWLHILVLSCYRCIIYQVGSNLCYSNKRNLDCRIHIKPLSTSLYHGQYNININTTLIIIYTVIEILFY